MRTFYTHPPYQIGDYYNDGELEGIVFEIWDNGYSGKIVSLEQSEQYLQWSTEAEFLRTFVLSDDKDYGANNMAVIQRISDWQRRFPAFKWCADLGERWYLPAKNELMAIYRNMDKINSALDIPLDDSCYWSSTEDNFMLSFGEVFAEGVCMSFEYTAHYLGRKDNFCLVRAVACFGIVPEVKDIIVAGKTHAPYYVGDYYNDGEKEGVVIAVWDNGRHGKILSTVEPTEDLLWAVEGAPLTNATNKDDGRRNMTTIKGIDNWQSLYPAFKWCAEQGEGWYLPSIEELAQLLLNTPILEAVNKTLVRKQATPLPSAEEGGWYWSSTEIDQTNAWSVRMVNKYIFQDDKSYDYSIRAVSRF